MDEIERRLKESSSEEIKYLFKGFLQILEDIKEDHDSAMNKLMDNFPELKKVLIVNNSFDENKMQRLRKRVLDLGNDTIRKNNSHVERIYLNLKFKH